MHQKMLSLWARFISQHGNILFVKTVSLRTYFIEECFPNQFKFSSARGGKSKVQAFVQSHREFL